MWLICMKHSELVSFRERCKILDNIEMLVPTPDNEPIFLSRSALLLAKPFFVEA